MPPATTNAPVLVEVAGVSRLTFTMEFSICIEPKDPAVLKIIFPLGVLLTTTASLAFL